MPRPIRILMTTDTVGGVWSYSLTLARALRAGYPEVRLRLLTLGPLPSPAQQREARDAGVLLHHLGGKLEWMRNPWPDLERQADALWHEVRLYRPQVLHLNHYAHTALPWHDIVPELVVVQGAHSCVNTWWMAVHGQPAPVLEYARYTLAVRRALHAANVVLVPTEAFGQMLQVHYGPLPHLRTIHNGIELYRWQPQSKQPHVLAAGRLWDPAKNLHVLAEAAAGLLAPVYLAGPDQEPGSQRVETYANVQPLGHLTQADLAAALGGAAIFAAPALYEPFGLAVAEAAASGCALVLADIPTYRELWAGAAVFVPSTQPEAWNYHLNALLRDPAAAAHWGELARIRVHRFSAAAAAARTRTVYSAIGQPAVTINSAAA